MTLKSSGPDSAPGTRRLEVVTQQVTFPDVAVSSDGDWLVFTGLGHLFRLPTAGGEAEQLTYGPSYDSDPTISPDGRTVAFVSDREAGADGDVFLLDLETMEVRRLTNERWAARPAWSPDGSELAYLSYKPIGMWAQYEFVGPAGLRTQVCRYSIDEGSAETIPSAPGTARSVFYLSDGRLAWSSVESDDEGRARSRIEVFDGSQVVTLLTIEGVADRVEADESGLGLYIRRFRSPAAGFLFPQSEELIHVRFDDATETRIVELSNPQPRPRFGAGQGAVYLGEAGDLLRIDAATGSQSQIGFTATMRIDAYAPTAPIRPADQGRDVTSVLDPRLTLDGASLVFTAAGYVWTQKLGGGAAKRLVATDGFQWGPASPSPDGRHLVYQHSEGTTQQLRIVDLASGDWRTLVSVDRTGRFEPAWSPDGGQIAYVGFAGAAPSVYLLEVESGESRKIVDCAPRWMPRPNFSSDGTHIYFTDQGQLRRVAIVGDNPAEPVTSVAKGHFADGTVSPDGLWVAFRRNEEIWVAPLGNEVVTDADARMLTDDGGLNFSFAPDSNAIVYATENRVWRQSLDGDGRDEITPNIDVPGSPRPSLLVENVRVLDYELGGFTEPTSLLIEEGLVAAIGADLPMVPGTRVEDAGGRFAIPGLFDMHAHTATPIHFDPARDVSHMAANIAYGVLAIRDMGSDITLVKAWMDRLRLYGDAVPRVFSAGAMTEATAPFFHGGSLFADTEEQARNLVRKQQRDGAIAIKSYFTLPWSLHRAIADEARRAGIPVVAHGLILREMVMGPVLGRVSVEHQPLPVRVYSDVMSLFAESGTSWCPTVAPTGGNGVLFAQDPDLLQDEKLRSVNSPGDFALAEEVELFSKLDPQTIIKAYTGLITSIGEAHQKGVRLLAGTDALNPNVFYGHGLHMELRHLARAGIPELDVLKFATLHAAATLGVDHLLGSIEADKQADLVLLNANPLEDIGNTLAIWRVIQGGRQFAGDATPVS
ncbi:MAG: amidohydrolase family protein [Acidimicrobiia bacterium]